ncbi:MAG TPA: hypothetical protein VFV89_14170 [Nocardioides sp.]|uniref:hypothetical protein n=1 Tax=Nocardioides sp. TaxID=35761 RepID=UPI002E37E2E2|nr:hypothetical protein [Nocardioides sp.]HEX5088949.1 hypothetical protein [Nocardioides sp.]
MRTRTLAWLGTALAVLSLGLPWRFLVGTPGHVTSGYYTNYCYYDYFGTYVCDTSFTPGVFVPGLTGGSYAGTDSVARFFIVAAIALALIGGLYVGSARPVRWAAYAGVAGVLLYAYYGLMGGLLAMAAASVCFWLAARHMPDEAPA